MVGSVQRASLDGGRSWRPEAEVGLAPSARLDWYGRQSTYSLSSPPCTVSAQITRTSIAIIVTDQIG
jgi:hypothetical protein